MNNKLTIQEVKQRLDNCIDLYVDFFCQKHEIDFDYWIGDLKGGIGVFGDWYFNFDDIRIDLDLEVPNRLIFDWYSDNLEFHPKSINYYSYIKGLRIKDIKE